MNENEIVALDPELVWQFVQQITGEEVDIWDADREVGWPMSKRLKNVLVFVQVQERAVRIRIVHAITFNEVETGVAFDDFEQRYDTSTSAGMHFAADELVDTVDAVAGVVALRVSAGEPMRYRNKAEDAAA